MPQVLQNTSISNMDDETGSSIKPSYFRQISGKRPVDHDDSENDVDEMLCKRGRLTTIDSSPCPLADFGCNLCIADNKFREHYSTRTHQEALLKAIDLYSHRSPIELKPNSNTLKDNENYAELSECVNVLAEGIACITDDNVQIHNTIVETQRNIIEQQKQLEELKMSAEETVQLVHSVQMNNSILENEIEDLRQKMQDLSSQISNDGTFIWKISNVAKKINDAISEKQSSVYSAPFYSSPTGYKMCLRLYFNGDGHARRTHLSLFFVIMRGDYDAILEWPFSHRITFCLYDQTGNKRHIIDSFRPDPKSNSFQRPRSNMNIASGIPKFCPLSMIQQDNNPYVRDDCMFIRCMVDFASTPKKVLPYIFSLNPGLPTNVQRTMIQAEIERVNSTPIEVATSVDSSPKNDSSK